MAFDPLREQMRKLTPAELKKLANQRLADVVLSSVARSRRRVSALIRRYPSAEQRELAQRLIDTKKEIASMVGGVSGVFGLVSLPADLLVMSWLQIGLLVDIATLHGVNLKSPRARRELLDLFAYANGLGPLQRAGPKVLGKVAGKLLERSGLTTFGRALPLVAAPVTAYLNNRHIQSVGDQALRYYHGFRRAHEKRRTG
ncbi:MAG TPA: EcsC family protein [Myxococcaceae bacterium]|nr:EcsC family protein [Myxococcaceae bacterium]